MATTFAVFGNTAATAKHYAAVSPSTKHAVSSSLSPYKASSGKAHGVISCASLAMLLTGAVGHATRRRNRCQSKRSSRLALQAEKERKLTERQENFWELLKEEIEEDVETVFPKEDLKRIYEFIEYCTYEKDIPELPELQEIDPEYFPGLTAKPWWEIEESGSDWIEKVKEGLPYVQGELADLLEENEQLMISDSVKNETMGSGWTGFRLQRMGSWIQRNCNLFPNTVQLLKDSGAPIAMRGVIIARQVPQSGVGLHSDGRNCFLTAHFGLSVPPKCNITVGGETREWKEDDCIIVDTSFKHSTRNDSDEDRFVLIVDFWHPDLTEAEREALEYIYDFRNKWEQGKLKYTQKMPKDFWTQFQILSPEGGAYTEESGVEKKKPRGSTIGEARVGF
eukprot:TRINITY_DN49789_c0_g1_i1.p1 TRINITY_DN49789_c0_g1~~TRINITY_DN49789_c0_g1_i1.p1  ORF type:complete len:394 (+),score=82.07 TRINITY_DN49789_c0_g1_i1:49-1230(+)